MISASPRPHLMVGVPTGYLSPRVPNPPNVDYNVSVGVEVAPGIGISLDGKALLVGPDGHQGRTDIIGHLKDGTYPQRDSVVLRDGESTSVDGHFDWQDYQLKGKSGDFTAEGHAVHKGFTVSETPNGLRIENPKAARAWTVESNENGFSVRSDWKDGETFQISQNGAVTTVDSNLDDQDFTITQQEGKAIIDGRYSVDDFLFSSTDDGYQIQGHYPQQHFAIKLT